MKSGSFKFAGRLRAAILTLSAARTGIMAIFRKIPSKESALPKIRHYCAYQERSHLEVQEKLYSLGLWKKEVQEILSQLIEENYLNEERYAIQFASGKFRMKQWGRIKIKYQLKQKGVSEYCMAKALGAIDEKDYRKTLEKLAKQKWNSLEEEKNKFNKKKKVQNYLIQKGYEYPLLSATLKELQ